VSGFLWTNWLARDRAGGGSIVRVDSEPDARHIVRTTYLDGTENEIAITNLVLLSQSDVGDIFPTLRRMGPAWNSLHSLASSTRKYIVPD